MSRQKTQQKLAPWAEAKKRHRLTDVHVQMARELGMNPKKRTLLAHPDSRFELESLGLTTRDQFRAFPEAIPRTWMVGYMLDPRRIFGLGRRNRI